MININCVQNYCCEDISLIENYALAISDDKKWVCHHRLEIVDGKSISINELKDKKLYYHRPASELIFMRDDEHRRLHNSNLRSETKIKISNASKQWHSTDEAKATCKIGKGKHPWNYGKPSQFKGTKKSPETIQRMKDAKKEWWKTHTISEEEHKRRSEGAKKVPPLSQEKREELRNLYKGKHWIIVDGKRRWVK